MIVAYCKRCLPTKVVIDWSQDRRNLEEQHTVHTEEDVQTGLFAIRPSAFRREVEVQGDREATRQRIIDLYGDEFKP